MLFYCNFKNVITNEHMENEVWIRKIDVIPTKNQNLYICEKSNF